MTTIRVHEGRIFNPRETVLPDGRRVLSATFHPGAQGGRPVTMVTDRPLLDDVFREGVGRRFLGQQTARNLVVLGSLAPIANPTLRRLATVVMALQQGQAIRVGKTTYRIGEPAARCRARADEPAGQPARSRLEPRRPDRRHGDLARERDRRTGGTGLYRSDGRRRRPDGAGREAGGWICPTRFPDTTAARSR